MWERSPPDPSQEAEAKQAFERLVELYEPLPGGESKEGSLAEHAGSAA